MAVIEIGADGAFDLSSEPIEEEIRESSGLIHEREAWEIRKECGNQAFSKKDYGLAIDFYSQALDLISVHHLYSKHEQLIIFCFS